MTTQKNTVVWQGELIAYPGADPKTMRVVIGDSIAFKETPVFYVEERELDRAGNERWSDRRLDEAGDAMLPRRAVASALHALHDTVMLMPDYTAFFDAAQDRLRQRAGGLPGAVTYFKSAEEHDGA